MALDFPHHRFGSVQELATRLLDSRKVGTPLETLARDLLAGFFELCMRAGLDGLLGELDVADWSALAEHPIFAPKLVEQLTAIDLDGGGPRGAKPRQVADCVVAALGLAVVEQPDRSIALDHGVRAEVQAALAGVLDIELGVPKIRETIIAAARERCEPRHLDSFNRIVAQLDEQGMHMVKQPKVPLDASQAIQHALTAVRTAILDRVIRAAIDRATQVLARSNAEAAARIAQPITLRLTPCDVAVLRASDARVSKSPAAVAQLLLDSIAELAQLVWRAPEQPVRAYAASQTFSVGDLIDHPKFGRGAVVSTYAQRIDVEFADGKHTLVHVAPRK